ncbi:MAG: isoleucine--tRNA ligase [Bacteroidota bacterium]
MNKYREYKQLDLPGLADEVLQKWDRENTFAASISIRENNKPFVFYEGPPSANGMPGIHHVMARSIKDIFCRYKTLKGYKVNRKAGWDTHGLPIELGVEKEMGITKEDIGKKITIEEYNNACRKAVMKYTGVWNDLTRKMGYWVDMNDPYITYENKYIESVWWLLKRIYDKGLLYKGYTIQPYSPAAGTGLSSHELNQPGCYRNVKDNTAVAMFKLKKDNKFQEFCKKLNGEYIIQKDLSIYILAWTTTPWTLPSNTALAIGEKINYFLVLTLHPQYKTPCVCIVAENVFNNFFISKLAFTGDEHYKYLEQEKDYLKKLEYLNKHDLLPKKGQPYGVSFGHCYGHFLIDLQYEQLLPYAKPLSISSPSPREKGPGDEAAFRVIPGDFVTTEDGTGIVHIAPTFGADDMRVAKEAGVPPMLVADENGKPVPLVDLQGRFRKEMQDDVFGFAGEYVKEQYLSEKEKEVELVKQKEKLKGIIADTSRLNYLSVDERIILKLQLEGKLFKKEKYEHNYPHCWRTDKPVLYYPLDSWFIKIPAVRDRMAELNKTINWKPESTGTGRFGNWLESANDWNLSRSRYWGIPLPIWRSEDGEEKCIGSAEELRNECAKSVSAGLMKKNPMENFIPGDFSEKNYNTFDLHRPYSDEIILVSSKGKPMKRELDLIDVWFDSGAMPYAQFHFPFENKELYPQSFLSPSPRERGPGGEASEAFPADFIAEGVDQTRGWFYTLHAIGTLCFDSVAYKNVVSNGLVLDKNGQKMSKRLGNAVDPFETLKKYGPDATRWYMITNAAPWENLKFDLEGISETQRKFFRAFYNSYAFFALYANIDGFTFKEAEIPIEKRPEIDRWIISKLNSLVKTVDAALAGYEPTRAGREMEEFVLDHLSNWYVRLCRRRFWKGEYTDDKIAAYQTLYTCLETLSVLSSSIAPFFSEKIFCDLNEVTKRHKVNSVHLADFPLVDEKHIDIYLEEKMALAQKISSMVLSLRKNKNIKVRQPLQKIMVPVLSEKFREQLKAVEEIILSEVNVKEQEYLPEDSDILVKTIKPNFKTLGARYKQLMKPIAAAVNAFGKKEIAILERDGKFELNVDNQQVVLGLEDVEITPKDVPGWLVASEGGITVALDISITTELREEGLAREVVNRIQNLRKDKGFDVTDKILIKIHPHPSINDAIKHNLNYICSETLASSLELVDLQTDKSNEVEVDEGVFTRITISKAN